MTLEEKWNNFEEVAARYHHLMARKAGYHPLNSLSLSSEGFKTTYWDYDKNELVTFEYPKKENKNELANSL